MPENTNKKKIADSSCLPFLVSDFRAVKHADFDAPVDDKWTIIKADVPRQGTILSAKYLPAVGEKTLGFWFHFLVPAHPSSPRKGPLNMCVC